MRKALKVPSRALGSARALREPLGASWRVLGAVLLGAYGDTAHPVEDNRHAGLAAGVWMQEAWQAVQEVIEAGAPRLLHSRAFAIRE